jgi:hypothetical protein
MCSPANKLTENGGWDNDLLQAEIGALERLGFDISLTGLEPLLGKSPAGIEDAPTSKYREQYGVIVVCSDEAHQRRVYEELSGSGHEVRVVVT